MIVNLKLLNGDSDDANYDTYAVPVCGTSVDKPYNTIFYVSKSFPKVIFKSSRYKEGMNRTIYYGTSISSYKKARSEGSSASGNSEVDKAYDFLGKIYNFYKDNFGRDSMDNRGMEIETLVVSSGRNAAYMGNGDIMVSSGLVADDVLAHEYTHGVTEYTGVLQAYQYQQGAINESFSDIMAVSYTHLTLPTNREV